MTSERDDDAERRDPNRRGLVAGVAAELYVLVVAGIATGVVVVGLGSRLAMLLLRVTSPDSVRGVESDDGFTIGQVTLAGTYNLMLLGATVGIIGAAAYQWVRPWLIGPRWFRRLTLACAAGAVVGSMLVHADGIDFVVLEPLWLAVSSFVLLPAVFAVCIAIAVDRVERWADRAREPAWRRWILPVVLVVGFPLTIFPLVFSVGVLVVWVSIRDLPALRRVAGTTFVGVLARAAWLGVAVLGLIALLGDVNDLRAIT